MTPSQLAQRVLELLATERRRVAALWRVRLYLRRLTVHEVALRPDETDGKRVLAHLRRVRAFRPVEGAKDVFLIDVPYASVLPTSEEQIVQEAHPLAVFSHLTALAHHALTDAIPDQLQVTEYGTTVPTRLPLGTTPEDWIDVEMPQPRRPRSIGQVPVVWYRAKPDFDFGHMVGQSQGAPIYLTDPERTLLDITRAPDAVGGIRSALRAWRRAGDRLDIERLVGHVERIDQAILRQRVGYILERLGRVHPALAKWKRSLVRGGSVRLLPSQPYAPRYSPEWNLSLNVPESALAELEE